MTSAEHLTELHTLLEKLDDLWEAHLNLIDAYQDAQTALAKHLSKGHFFLARANFRSPGRGRYGQDYYDERMKASSIAHIKEGESGGLELSMRDTKVKDIPLVTASLKKISVNDQDQLPTPESTPGRETSLTESDERDQPEEEPQEEVKLEDQSTPRGPLHWFGILVPQELRAAQISFIAAVNGPILDAVNTARRLRDSEVEIGRTRKAIKKAEKSTTELPEQAAQAV